MPGRSRPVRISRPLGFVQSRDRGDGYRVCRRDVRMAEVVADAQQRCAASSATATTHNRPNSNPPGVARFPRSASEVLSPSWLIVLTACIDLIHPPRVQPSLASDRWLAVSGHADRDVREITRGGSRVRHQS